MRPTDYDPQYSQKRIADVIDIKKSSASKYPSNKNFVDYLFNRFLFIWGIKWANKIADVEDGARNEWASAIEGMSRKQIDAGIIAARNQCQWPPEIAEFLPLCKGEVLVQANHFICSINSCPNPGTMCRATHGSNWVCNQHYNAGKG